MKPDSEYTPEDAATAHAMQLWLWRALVEQLMKQQVIQPWDLYQGLSQHDRHAWATTADKEGFIFAIGYVKNMAHRADSRPYDERPKPTEP